MNILFDAPLVDGLQAPPLKAELSVDDALARLLAGTRLRVVRVNENTVSVVTQDGAKNNVETPWVTDSDELYTPTGMRLAYAGAASNARDNYLGDASDSAKKKKAGDGSTLTDARGKDLEEVVVSAQKREERLKDVPISISVLSGDDLDKSSLVGITDALNQVPGVIATAGLQGGGTQIVVRGVGASGPLFNGSSPIAYYLDSVPFGLVKSAIAPDSDAYDLERMEVLRGPQGTLYGASAQNGVVRILTKDADFSAFDLKARTGLSTTDGGGENYRGDLAVNVPIIEEKLAARAVVGYEKLSGWIDSPIKSNVNGGELRNYRLKINAHPTDKLSISLSSWNSRNNYGGPSTSLAGERITSVVPQPISADYDAYGLKANYEWSRFSISSMTSYLSYNNKGYLDITPAGLAATLFTGLDARVFSEELILNSKPNTAWRWTAGAFFRDAKDRLRQNNLGPGAPFDYGNGSKSYAAFGEVGRRFFKDVLEWTLGVRYFHDNVFVKENISQGLPGEPPQDNKESFNATTPRAVLTWYPHSDLTVYGSYSQGFRSGFPQDPGVERTYPTFPPAKPDKLHNYEIGAKGDLWDKRISFDTALYYIDWRDVQQTLSVPFGGTFVSAVVNSESASGVGVDFGITARPLEGLKVGVNFGWNNLTLDSAVNSGGVLLFDKGDRLNYSPEYIAGASTDYTFPFGGTGFKGQLSASATYSSKQVDVISTGGPRFVSAGDTFLIARSSVSLIAPDHWTATVYVDNLNNEKGAYPAIDVVPEWVLRVRPRTAGLQFDYRFR